VTQKGVIRTAQFVPLGGIYLIDTGTVLESEV
jgi:hypothetical protein